MVSIHGGVCAKSSRRILAGVAVLAVGLTVYLVWFSRSAYGLQEFVPVDTSRLLVPPDPPAFDVERVYSKLKFQRPVELTHAGDGSNRLFVVEQEGAIRVFEGRPGVREMSVFLDLRDSVSRVGNEEGLLGLAFHPASATTASSSFTTPARKTRRSFPASGS